MSNPKTNPQAKLITQVEKITPELSLLAETSGSDLGTGGMVTKLQAAKIAVKAGIDTYVINGRPVDNIYRVLEGRPTGTWFLAEKSDV